MRTKTKKTAPSGKIKKTVSRKKTSKGFEAHYLAAILIAFLLLEGFLFTSTTGSDWKQAVSILDVSTSVAETASNIKLVMQPVVDAIVGVNQFYQLSATEMTKILDVSQNSPLEDVVLVTGGVNEFYQQASVELAKLLDMSGSQSWPSQIAGISITR